jgi:ABC-2 type transport system permease protein
MSLVRVIRYAFATGWQEFRTDTWAPGWLLRIVAQAAFFSMLGQLLDSPTRLEYLLIGNIVVVGALATAIAVPQSTWDRSDGTYPLLVIAPTNLLFPTLGRTLCRLVGAILFSLAGFVVLSLLFDIPHPWPEVLAIAPLLALTCLGCYCLMLFLGAVANYIPQARNLVHNTATMSLMAFSGVNVPLSFWPGWLQVIANCLPITHGLKAVRLLLAGGDASSVLTAAGLELLVAASWLTLAALTMDRMANAGRASGSIEFVG